MQTAFVTGRRCRRSGLLKNRSTDGQSIAYAPPSCAARHAAAPRAPDLFPAERWGAAGSPVAVPASTRDWPVLFCPLLCGVVYAARELLPRPGVDAAGGGLPAAGHHLFSPARFALFGG